MTDPTRNESASTPSKGVELDDQALDAVSAGGGTQDINIGVGEINIGIGELNIGVGELRPSTKLEKPMHVADKSMPKLLEG